MRETFRVRQCCVAALASGPAGVLEPVDVPPERELSGAVIKARVSLEPVRDRSAALHEAAHFATGHALGAEAAAVTIDRGPHVVWERPAENASLAAMVALAGEIGQRWAAHRLVAPDHPDDVRELIRAIKNLEHGRCDKCQATLAICRLVGASAPDPKFIAKFREIEAATVEIVRLPKVTRAICVIADELMKQGTLDGPAARALVEPFVPAGSLVDHCNKSTKEV